MEKNLVLFTLVSQNGQLAFLKNKSYRNTKRSQILHVWTCKMHTSTFVFMVRVYFSHERDTKRFELHFLIP